MIAQSVTDSESDSPQGCNPSTLYPLPRSCCTVFPVPFPPQPFFCANPNVTDPTIKAQSSVGDGAAPTPTSANIQLSTVRPLTIRVHEQEEAVEVDAGVVVWDLIDYLAHYVTPTAPAGWTLVRVCSWPRLCCLHDSRVCMGFCVRVCVCVCLCVSVCMFTF